MKKINMLKAILPIMMLSLLLGCGGKSTTGNNNLIEETGEITFIDSKAFDKTLSNIMKNNHSPIETQFVVPFDVNNIPERLDKWLFKISDSGGQVATAEISEDTSKGWLNVAILLIGNIYKGIKERGMYNPAKKYDALLLFEKETGDVKKVIFTLR